MSAGLSNYFNSSGNVGQKDEDDEEMAGDGEERRMRGRREKSRTRGWSYRGEPRW